MRAFFGGILAYILLSLPVAAQDIPLIGPDLSGRSVQLIALITILSIVPGLSLIHI